LGDELLPSIARGVDDGVVSFEDAVREPRAKARLSQWWKNDLPIVNWVASLINSKIAASYVGFSVSARPRGESESKAHKQTANESHRDGGFITTLLGIFSGVLFLSYIIIKNYGAALSKVSKRIYSETKHQLERSSLSSVAERTPQNLVKAGQKLVHQRMNILSRCCNALFDYMRAVL
jgi:hypothetical protein